MTQAVEHYRRALSLKDAYPEAHSNLAAVLRDFGDLDGAVEHYRRALALMPGLAQVHSNLLFLLSCHPKASPESLYTEHMAWNARHARPLKPAVLHHANERNPERRLRIGYVSPDLRGHVCSHYLSDRFVHRSGSPERKRRATATSGRSASSATGTDQLGHETAASANGSNQITSISTTARVTGK